MFFCKDKKWKKLPDPSLSASMFADPSKVQRKTIFFVRHGESCWNDTFNAGERKTLDFVKGFIPGLIKASCYEGYLLLSGQVDSWFYDSPLSDYGIVQIERLAKHLSRAPAANEKEYFDILRGESSKKSVLVSSNLRRALSTVLIAFRQRLAKNPDDKVVVTPTLQEVSQNPDTLSLTMPFTPVVASWIERDHLPYMQGLLNDRVDMSQHTGNKPLNTNGLKRMMAFNEFAFGREEEALICGGHSLWFRDYFKNFQPYDLKLDDLKKNETAIKAANKKMVNGGCVAFELMRAEGKDGKPVYCIDQKTVVVIYGGF